MKRSPHIQADIYYLRTDEGGRESFVATGYRGQFHYQGDERAWDAPQTFIGSERVLPGENVQATLQFMSPEEHHGLVSEGMLFDIREGYRLVGRGIVTKVFPELETDALLKSAT